VVSGGSVTSDLLGLSTNPAQPSTKPSVLVDVLADHHAVPSAGDFNPTAAVLEDTYQKYSTLILGFLLDASLHLPSIYLYCRCFCLPFCKRCLAFSNYTVIFYVCHCSGIYSTLRCLLSLVLAWNSSVCLRLAYVYSCLSDSHILLIVDQSVISLYLCLAIPEMWCCSGGKGIVRGSLHK